MSKGRPRSHRVNYPPHIDAAKLPEYCYWDGSGRGHWYTNTVVDGKRRRHRIAGPNATLSQLHKILEQGGSADCLNWIHAKFKASPQYAILSKKQKQSYEYGFDMVSKHATTNPNFTVGQMPLSQWRPGFVQKLIDSLAEKRGPSAAKKGKEYMSRAFNWAMNREYINTNPVGKPEMPKERKQQRLPDWPVLSALVAFAKERGSQAKRSGSCAPYIWIALEVCRKCRFRGIEAFTMNDTQLLDQGIRSERRKGSKDNITRWDAGLQAAINAALEHRSRVQKTTSIRPEDRLVIVGTSGQPINERTWQSAWRRFIGLAIKEEIISPEQRFGLHDMKRRGTTDVPGNRASKLEATGLSDRVLDVYDKSKPLVNASPDPKER